jgi:hypothetical protein
MAHTVYVKVNHFDMSCANRASCIGNDSLRMFIP